MRAWLIAAMLVPAAASAHSDRALFDDPAIVGGAGGRYFTGSRVDGYACSVCHTGGGTTDAFTIDPLPETLEAGRRYDIFVRWTQPELQHSLNFELSMPNGGNPMIVIPTGGAVPRESRCNQAADGVPAVYLIEAGVRRVVGIEPCGASMVNASFVANGGPIELSIGAVIGDNSETPIGDATFERRITLGVRPAGPDGGCAASNGGLGAALAVLAVLRARSRTAP